MFRIKNMRLFTCALVITATFLPATESQQLLRAQSAPVPQAFEHVVASKEMIGEKYPNLASGYVGIGYDIFKGNPEGDPASRTMVDPGFRKGIVDLEFSQEYRNTGMSKLRPKYGFAITEKSCQMAKQSTKETESSDYSKNLKTDASVAISATKKNILTGSKASASFGASAGYSNFAQTVATHKVERFLMKSYCLVYRSGVDTNQPLKVKAPFSERVKALKSKTDPEFDEVAWHELFRDYGTHFLSDVHFGGKMNNIMYMKSSSVRKLSKKGFNAGLSLEGSVTGKSAEGSASVSLSKEEGSSAESTADSEEKCFQQYTLGGDPHNEFADWARTVPNSPMPVKYKLSQFDELNIFQENNLAETYAYMLSQRATYVKDVTMGGLLSKDVENTYKDMMKPGERRCSVPGTDAVKNGGSCGMLNSHAPDAAALIAGDGSSKKQLSINADANLRITAEYGEEDTVWNNGLTAPEAKYCMEYTRDNNFVIYHADNSANDPIWQTKTNINGCVAKAGMVLLTKEGFLEVWGIDKNGTPDLTWYAGKDAKADGFNKCVVAEAEECVEDAENKDKIFELKNWISRHGGKRNKNRRRVRQNEINELKAKINLCNEAKADAQAQKDIIARREKKTKEFATAVFNRDSNKEGQRQAKLHHEKSKYMSPAQRQRFDKVKIKYSVRKNQKLLAETLKKMDASTLLDCLEACDKLRECTGATWHSKKGVGHCTLAKGLAAETIDADNCFEKASQQYGTLTQTGALGRKMELSITEGDWGEAKHPPFGCSVENDGDNLQVHWNSNSDTESTQGHLEGDRYLKVVDTIGTTAGDDGENAYIRNDNVLRAKGGDGDGYAIGCKNYDNDVGYIQFLQNEINTGKKSRTPYARTSEFLEISARKSFSRREEVRRSGVKKWNPVRAAEETAKKLAKKAKKLAKAVAEKAKKAAKAVAEKAKKAANAAKKAAKAVAEKAKKAANAAKNAAKKAVGAVHKSFKKAVNFIRNPSGNKLSKNMRRAREKDIKAVSLLIKQCEAFRENCKNDKDCSLTISV